MERLPYNPHALAWPVKGLRIAEDIIPARAKSSQYRRLFAAEMSGRRCDAAAVSRGTPTSVPECGQFDDLGRQAQRRAAVIKRFGRC